MEQTLKNQKIELPFDDIKSQEDHDRFVEIAKEAIGRELNSGRVIVSVAGGRKAGADEFYHIIAEEIHGTHPGPLALLKEFATLILKKFMRTKLKPQKNLN